MPDDAAVPDAAAMMRPMWVDEGEKTEADGSGEAAGRAGLADVAVRGFQLEVVDGPQAGSSWQSEGDRASVGSHESNDLVIPDRVVSRFHFEIRIERQGPRIVDLQSTNGTLVDGVPIVDAWLRDGSLVRIGETTVSFRVMDQSVPLRLSPRDSFGNLVGRSAAMRSAFAVLERAAACDATVVLEGETGTGKTEAALAVHEVSERSEGPFIVVDCSAIPRNLLESELFGHERGAFTGAIAQRIGAFEAADGGTLFLDEIGELPANLQPKLLRVLEQRVVRRVGSNEELSVDCRVIAATNQDLRAAVNRGDFRSDLYYRLAVIRTTLPPLRQRPEDIPPLVARLLRRRSAEPQAALTLLEPEFLAGLQRGAWPGNVRQLRNHLERCLVFGPADPVPQPTDPGPYTAVDTDLPFTEARRRALERFERAYLEAILSRYEGNVSKAARGADLNRVYLHRLLRRHGLRG